MSICITLAGEALIASLQAQGLPLVIDTMIFANVPGLDPAQAADRAQAVPTENVVHSADIPAEYRAFVNPNQVVYSVLLGSDVGDFTFNWQGLYCSAHHTLIAVAELPAIEKRANDAGTNTPGNNLTRNFMLQFSGAQALAGLTIEAEVWQLDFTVRLKGIDERERLSNRDIYGRAAFLDDGWLLVNAAGTYHFEPGTGYVEGIRAALASQLPVVPAPLPCDVFLDVCQAPQGSDVVTLVTPRFVAQGAGLPDYTEAAPFHTPHYCAQVAHVAADGVVTDLRTKGALLINEATSGHNTDPEAHRAFTTPPQFDVTQKPATTAFVQRALGSLRGITGVSENTTLSAAHAGVLVNLSSANPFAVTLPVAVGVASGASIEFCNTSTGTVTVQRQATDNIVCGVANITSFAIGPGDRARVTSMAGSWVLTSGSAQLGYAGAFGASLAANGYQKLPSGLIVQWGQFYGAATAGAAVPITFPITFPTAFLSITGFVGGYTGNAMCGVWFESGQVNGVNAHASIASIAAGYIALGK